MPGELDAPVEPTPAPRPADDGVEIAAPAEDVPLATLAVWVADSPEYCRSIAAAIAAGRPALPAIGPPPELRNCMWVAIEYGPRAGIYASHGAAARAAGSHPAGLVRVFASGAEAYGYVAGLGHRVPDRRQ